MPLGNILAGILLYADDLTLLAKSHAELPAYRLSEVNLSKRPVVEFGQRPPPPPGLELMCRSKAGFTLTSKSQ